MDGGSNPCNLVYIDNLVQAILLALTKPEAIHEVFFVTDREVVTWEKCLEDHAALLGLPVPRVPAADLAASPKTRWFIDSLRTAPRVLVSGEFRTVLRQIPLIQSVEKFLWNRFDALPVTFKERIRFRLVGPPAVWNPGSSTKRFEASDNIILAQGRTVAHSCDKISRLLGYSAPISYADGMCLTEAWLRAARFIDRAE